MPVITDWMHVFSSSLLVHIVVHYYQWSLSHTLNGMPWLILSKLAVYNWLIKQNIAQAIFWFNCATRSLLHIWNTNTSVTCDHHQQKCKHTVHCSGVAGHQCHKWTMRQWHVSPSLAADLCPDIPTANTTFQMTLNVYQRQCLTARFVPIIWTSWHLQALKR